MDTNEPNERNNNDDATFLNDNPNFVVTGNESEAGDDAGNGSVAQTTIDTNRTSVLQLDLESLKDLQASLISSTMLALQNRKTKKVEPHLEGAFLTSLGTYPAGRKGIDIIRWVTKMDTLVNTYLRDVEPKETVKILFRTVLCPEVTNQLSLAFKLSSASITIIKPPIWNDDWTYPIDVNTPHIHTWFARVLLAHGCSRETMADFVRSLAPSRQQDKEKYSNLVQRLQALKSMANRCANLFPGKYEIYKPEAYDHYLVSELEPRLARRVNDVLDNEKKNRDNILDVMRIRHLDIPEQPAKTHLEMTQLIRKVAAKIESDSDGSDSDNEAIGRGAKFTNMMPANVNFVLYDGVRKEKKKVVKEKSENNDLQSIVEKQQKLIDNLLALKQQELRPHYQNYYNANTVPLGKTLPPSNSNFVDVECRRCSNRGHYAADCKAPSGPIRRPQGSSRRRPEGPYGRTPSNQCANCRETTHRISECQKPPSRPCRFCQGNHFDIHCNARTIPGEQPAQAPQKEKNVSFRVTVPMDNNEPRITELE